MGSNGLAFHLDRAQRITIVRVEIFQFLERAGTEFCSIESGSGRFGRKFEWKFGCSFAMNGVAAEVVRNLVSQEPVNPGFGTSGLAQAGGAGNDFQGGAVKNLFGKV